MGSFYYLKKIIVFGLLHVLSFKVPVRFVMVELDTLGTDEVGEDLHDVILLLGREFVFSMMITVVGTHACAKV